MVVSAPQITTQHSIETGAADTSGSGNNDRICWFVMRAYKCEGKAEERLSGDDGLEHFIPKHYAVRVYHGVKSRRLVPVIPSLVFVRASRRQLIRFKKRQQLSAIRHAEDKLRCGISHCA